MTLVATPHHHHVFGAVPNRYYCNALRSTAAATHRSDRRVSLVRSKRVHPSQQQSPSPSSFTPTKKKSVRFSETVEHIHFFYQWEAPATATTRALRSVQQRRPDRAKDSSGGGLVLVMANPAEAHDNKNGKTVQLEQLSVQPPDGDRPLQVVGQCLVVNLGFEKHVVVRYTFDNWATFVDEDAMYQGPCSTTNSSQDRFSFAFAWQGQPCPQQHVQLALRYLVNGQDFWDNNNGQNYRASIVVNQSAIRS